jgi:hypothetical protein
VRDRFALRGWWRREHHMSNWERFIVCVIGIGATGALIALAVWLHPGVISQIAAVSAIVTGTAWMILMFISAAEVLSSLLSPPSRSGRAPGAQTSSPDATGEGRRAA